MKDIFECVDRVSIRMNRLPYEITQMNSLVFHRLMRTMNVVDEEQRTGRSHPRLYLFEKIMMDETEKKFKENEMKK